MLTDVLRESNVVLAVSEAKNHVDNIRKAYGGESVSEILDNVYEDMGIEFVQHESLGSCTPIPTVATITVSSNKEGLPTIGVTRCEYDSDLVFCRAFGFGFYYSLLSEGADIPFALFNLNLRFTVDDIDVSNAEFFATALFLLIPSSDVEEVRREVPGDDIAQALALCRKHRSNGVGFHKAKLRLILEDTANSLIPGL